ncbi:MAG: glycosyltransferase family 4 protein [Blastocatellia bacterium]|nr:glycosyltransferase family 4 protein [Blastocatellia bacterium]
MLDTDLPPLGILWLTENYHPNRGGMAVSCDRIVHSLRQAGVSIDVAHFARHLQAMRVEAKRNGRYIACPTGDDTSHAMNCLWNVIASDRGAQPITHVVAFGGVLPMLAGPVYAAWLRVPLVTMIRGNDFDASVFAPKRGDILREALKRSARVCTVSRDKAAKIRALHPEISPLWIPNGIDLTEWEPLPSHLRRAAEWREKSVPQGRRVLGMFGQIKQKKGGLFFLQNLLDSGHAERFHLLFVGDLEEAVHAWLREREAEVSYSHYPFADRYELLTHYSACDLVVIASFYDGMPNVLLEAASLGVPLLASTAGGMGDVLEDERHGFLFYPGDVHECRRSVARAARASDERLKSFGEECRSLVREKLTARIERDRYLSLLVETFHEFSNPESECDRDEDFENIDSMLTGEPQ